MLRLALPIDGILPEAVRLLETGTNLVLQASPGSGKTTRLPPALLRAQFRRPQDEILVLEPRRVAAKYAAARVAQEMGETPGKTVGYQFRFENVSSPATRLRFLTEGMLMRRLLGDPQLKNVAAVVLDEFHERHLHGDIALAYLKQLQATRRPDLRIVVMSATLDAKTIAEFLGSPSQPCPILSVDTRLHPIEIEHLPGPPAKHLDLLVKEAVQKALSTEGDILVFLPGMGEIRRCTDTLSAYGERGIRILPLHGDLTREEQDAAILPAKGQRKIILSTNVAETSLTIEGVRTVIDSGLHRQASYSWWSGVPALRTRPVSRASAIQRAGRAGRTGPGRCLRLYPLGDFNSRAPFETPEIQRADISQTVLELKAIGVEDFATFPWFEAPSATSLEASLNLLYRLGALDGASSRAKLTEIGRVMASLPAHPRLSRMLLAAQKGGVLEEAATLAALISEGGLDRLDSLECLRGAEMNPVVRRTRTHLLGAFQKERLSTPAQKIQLAQAVLAGFPDRVARKRKKSSATISLEAELLFSSGGSGRVEESGVVREGDTFVTLDIQEQQGLGQLRSQVRVRSLCLIQPEWLFDVEPSPLRETSEVLWDAERKRVAGAERLSYDELILTEERGTPTDLAAASRVLLKQGLGIDPEKMAHEPAGSWIAAFAQLADAEALETSLARLALLREHFPSFNIPEFSPNLFLAPLTGKFSLTEAAATDWPRELLEQALAQAEPTASARLEELVPTSVTLPGGRRARVNYKLGQPPWVESRLQDFFGMARGPSVLGGRIPLTLHLLAPNQRAVQVTTDLAGFWERGYQELRTMLSRRYPRHAWPEDPLRASPPERRPGPGGSSSGGKRA